MTPPTCARPLRASESDDLLHAAIDEAIARKPKGHDFVIDRRHRGPALARHMSVTGGSTIPKSGHRFPAFAKPASAGEGRSDKIMRKMIKPPAPAMSPDRAIPPAAAGPA